MDSRSGHHSQSRTPASHQRRPPYRRRGPTPPIPTWHSQPGRLYRPLLNEWRLYDNTGRNPHLIATENNGQLNIVDLTRLALIERTATVRFMPEASARFVEEERTFTADEVTRRSLRAMRKAFADVVLENKAYGLPVIQWRDDRGMVEVPAEQLEPLARRILEVDGDPLPPDEERALLAHLKI